MKKIILSTAILALVFIGCKKDEVKPTDSSSSSTNNSNSSTSSLLSVSKISKQIRFKVDSQGNVFDSIESTFSYDSDGRCITQINNSNWYKEISNAEYTSSKVIITSTFITSGSNDDINKYIFILDTKGVITKSYKEGKSDTTRYLLTPEGFLKKNNQVFEVIGENIVKEGSSTYEYYLDKINTVGYLNYGNNFFGKSSKNLVKSEKYSYQDSNGENFKHEYNYTYEFDSKNRVIKSIKTEINSNTSLDISKQITIFEYI